MKLAEETLIKYKNESDSCQSYTTVFKVDLLWMIDELTALRTRNAELEQTEKNLLAEIELHKQTIRLMQEDY